MTLKRPSEAASFARANLVNTIDKLLAAETGSLMHRLREVEAYVPAGAAEAALAVAELVAEDARHAQKLVELLDQLDATPGPRCVEIASGDLHFNRIHTLIPRLIADQKRLVAVYTWAQAEVSGDARAADAVSQLLASHRTHLKKLEELAGATQGT